MLKTISLAAVGVTLLSLACVPLRLAAQTVTAGDLVIGHPWSRATPGGAEVAGGYFSITNHGRVADTLKGGSSTIATSFELHQMTMENGVMQMRQTGPVIIAPGATVTFDPMGRHVMLTGLKHGLKKGESFAATLEFEHAGAVPVTFSVEGIGAKAPAGTATTSHSMPGMTMD